MDVLRKFKLGSRISFGFGILLLLLVTILSINLYGSKLKSEQFTYLTDVNMVKMRLLNDMLDTNNAVLMHRRLMLIKRGNGFAADAAHAEELNRKYDAIWEQYVKIPRDTTGDRMIADIEKARDSVAESTRKFEGFMRASDFEAATQVLLDELRPRAMAWNETISSLLKHQVALTAKSSEDYHDIEAWTGKLSLGIGLLSFVLGVTIAVVITRSLTRPLASAVGMANNIADGRLNNVLDISGKDEVTDLLHAMQGMQGQMRSVIAAQSEMAQQHNAGSISYRIDAAPFKGEYRRMVEESNELVGQHIDVKLRIIDVMRSYARGDLSTDMDRLPGEKAAITQAMDETKASLSVINAEIRRLANAAAKGDFTQRGDEHRFDHDFRDMIAGLNRLMETTDSNLSEVSALLHAIAEGDLTAHMEGDFHGVFATMRDDANATVGQLTSIIERIRLAAGSINVAASEIANGNSDLSRRTEQQAASLEETAASMEELTSTVRQNAEHARQANQLSQGAASVASEGGRVVDQVVSNMADIERASHKIADIISVIDGIAFQTNILALNAAVEAARAGEQGRGFAVVASEVRTLAQRSAGAAKEIKELIENSVAKVSEGSVLVNQAGATMGEIVTSVQRVTDIMAEISSASQEQSAGIEQVNRTVVQMDEATQQNAALVEEATAAARAMEEQANNLGEAVSVFRMATTANDTLMRPTDNSVLKQHALRLAPAPRRLGIAETVNANVWQEF